ncbi:MAG: hypothetical protein PHI34_06650 [Acidobacteriota bacterium]|nr:hypothetical protein [Acidobacteriota bacterium]
MHKKAKQIPKEKQADLGAGKAPYLPPSLVTYDKNEVIEIIGPALACASSDACPVTP